MSNDMCSTGAATNPVAHNKTAPTTDQNRPFHEGVPLKIVSAGTDPAGTDAARAPDARRVLSSSIDPQWRHLMAASWISSAQNGQGFIFMGLGGYSPPASRRHTPVQVASPP